MTAPRSFDVCGDLPSGTTVLEASAGTGKTFTIAAMTARFVAEGRTRLSDLMLVTFGRAATEELRERIRERLVTAERGLADPGRARESRDMVLALLAGTTDDEVRRRRERLAGALAAFDAATIATTHQFCMRMLTGLGMAADKDPDATFVENLDDLVTEVSDDLYVRKFAGKGAPDPVFTRADALEIARAAVGDFQAVLQPADAPPSTEADMRYRFAVAVRREVADRKRRLRLYGYDDMLTGLEAALTDPTRGESACKRLQERYSVVLVDEFQDTDPVQWNILRTAFHGHRTLVLIGDPKQAIYAFRGADVTSYLAAADTAGTRATLAVNWRSDEPLLSALQTVFGGAALGDPRIAVHPVGAGHRGRRLSGAPVNTPLRIRVLRRAGLPLGRNRLPTIAPARAAVAKDVAGDLHALLGSGARLGDRPLLPRDVAVLVRTHRQSTQIQDALVGIGIPAVLGSSSSVFATPAAQEWLTLLAALEQPHRAARVAAAALTGFVGWSAATLAAAPERDMEELGTTLRRWAEILSDRGVAALMETITATGQAARLLGGARGERRLTDVRHIGLALHAAVTDGQLGLTATAEWLRRRIEQAPQDVSLESSRRLESDADAVQILTVHSSKGLQFPVVYVPFGWDRRVTDPELLRFHDEDGARTLDVGGKNAPTYRDLCRRHHAEDGGEDLRLLYVALTRAECQVVTWWAPSGNTLASALHRLLLGRGPAGTTPAGTCPVPSDEEVLAALREFESPDVAVEPIRAADVGRWSPFTLPAPELTVARFRRALDTAWRRTSYSALTAAAHEGPGVRSEPEQGAVDDEAILPVDVSPPPIGDEEDVASPMAGLAGGAAFGTLVHAIAETVDPSVPDLHAELTGRAREQLARHGVDMDAGTLAHALLPAYETPLGPLLHGRSLRDIEPADRLAELDFELPLCGGDDGAGGEATLADVGRLLERHLGQDDPLTGYGQLLQAPALGSQRLRGYLAGSIDAVLRVEGPRYVVVDYKTNRLGVPGSPTLTALDYRPDSLAQAMTAAHYPLQALLYSVALHRFLRWRQPGYDPQRHLGGVLYLFLRGMCGPRTPAPGGVPCGVFSWRPPGSLVDELSVLLAGGAR